MPVFHLICYRFSGAGQIALPLNAAYFVAIEWKKTIAVPHKTTVLVRLSLAVGTGRDKNTLQHAILSPAALREVPGLKSRHNLYSFSVESCKSSLIFISNL